MLPAPVWDESTRPSAPPPPAGHVYTRMGKAVGQHLAQVHDHLRSELSQVRELLRRVKQGSLDVGRAREAISEMTMRQHNWTLGAYCASYCAIVAGHHGLEDQAIFPHLRGADPGLTPVIDRLEAEHVVIHEVMQDVDRALVNLVRSPGDFSEIDEAVDLLAKTLLSHLEYEERQITEPLTRFGFFAGQV
jgi:hemerythrin-like domain-containing protein